MNVCGFGSPPNPLFLYPLDYDDGSPRGIISGIPGGYHLPLMLMLMLMLMPGQGRRRARFHFCCFPPADGRV